ncbi:MAG: glycosyltransferase [Clostridia bacterium]|nr:glycosyltransferase [Clostridia bacterium]
MRILIFTEVVSPYVCGISSYIDVLKMGLEKLSHKVVIVTSSMDTEKAYCKNGIIWCPAKKAKNKYGYECKNCEDESVIDFICACKPDVVHIHTDTKIGYMGLKVADRAKIPVVFTIHDYFMDRFAAENKLVWKYRTFFERKHFEDMLDNAGTVTSSCSRAEMFVRRARKRNEVTIIPCAVDRDLFNYKKYDKNTTSSIRRYFGLSDTSTVAVFAGSLTIEKNLEFALSAFAKYIKKTDNIQFLMVGDGTETEYLKEQCRKLQIDDMVFFAGTVPNDKMPVIYSACDMYVCSYDDGLMSMSFGEAMSCGLPVMVKYDNENIASSMVQENINGFVYKNEEEFAKCLKTFANLGMEEKKNIKKTVRNTVPKDSCVEMAKEYIAIYEKTPLIE